MRGGVTPIAPETSNMVESRAAKMVREVFESGRVLTYIRTTEEQRVAGLLKEVSLRLHASKPVNIWTWSLTEGMHREDGAPEAGTQTARGALDFVASYPGAAIFHLKDF